MKYIRTEYGLGEWLTIDKCWHYSSSITIDDNPRKQLKPIRQADTIGKLCDEFVVTDKVYGAIWTDKGLIYVAKLNEKGELELI